MIITQQTLDDLRVTFDKIYGDAYSSYEGMWDELAMRRPSTTSKNVYGWLAHQLKLEEWIGPRIADSLLEHVHEVENRKFQKTVSISRERIEDDELEIYTGNILPQLGTAAAKFPDQLLRDTLQANAVGWDGVTLFNDAHPAFDDAGSTYDNNFALALNPDNFNTVWAAMASYVGEDGEPQEVMPNKLIVPPQLRKAALETVQAATVLQDGTGSAAPTNVLQGWCDVVVMRNLSNEPTTWYLADTTKGVMPFVFQERTTPEMVARFDPTDPYVFEQDEYVWGVRYRCNMAASLPFLIAKSVPA